MRQSMPERRANWTQHVHLNNQSVYLNVGLYEDGRPGEIFIDVAKTGTFLRGILGALARVFSVSLQHGTPLLALTDVLKDLRFPPEGIVEGSEAVKEALSLVDWIARELEAAFPPVELPVEAKTFGEHHTGSGN